MRISRSPPCETASPAASAASAVLEGTPLGQRAVSAMQSVPVSAMQSVPVAAQRAVLAMQSEAVAAQRAVSATRALSAMQREDLATGNAAVLQPAADATAEAGTTAVAAQQREPSATRPAEIQETLLKTTGPPRNLHINQEVNEKWKKQSPNVVSCRLKAPLSIRTFMVIRVHPPPQFAKLRCRIEREREVEWQRHDCQRSHRKKSETGPLNMFMRR